VNKPLPCIRYQWLMVITVFTLCVGVNTGVAQVGGAANLAEGFSDPPRETRLRAYWRWLDGNVTKDNMLMPSGLFGSVRLKVASP